MQIYKASKTKHHLYFLLKQFSNYREEILFNMETLFFFVKLYIDI